MFQEGSGELERFEREFKAIARLDHPNLVKVYDWGQSDGRLYYITELKNAKSLQGLLDEGRAFGLDEVLGIGVDLTQALGYLHEQGILHRGLAPDSVLYDPDSKRAIVSEFTVIKDTQRSDLTAQGVGHLSPMQTTPESVGSREADARVDLFLLGQLLFRLLTRRDPPGLTAAGVSAAPAGETTAMLLAVPAVANAPEAAAAVAKAMEWEPEQRFADAAEMGAALADARERLRLADRRGSTKRTRALTGEPTTVRRPTVAVPPQAAGSEAADPAVSPGPPGGWPVGILALGIGLPLVLLLALAWLAR